MKHRQWTILFTATASNHVEAIAEWWTHNRQAAPTLFAVELISATERLSHFPETGAPFESLAVPDLRRVLLPHSRYHVYYTIHPVRNEVMVRAVWHAARGKGPKLR